MPKQKRWPLYAGIVASSILLAGIVLLHLLPGPASRSNFNRIQMGMTEAEVEKILGAPTGYSNRRLYTDPPAEFIPPQGGPRDPKQTKVWESDEDIVWVFFRSDGTVEDKAFRSNRRPAPSLSDRIKQWLGWKQQRSW